MIHVFSTSHGEGLPSLDFFFFIVLKTLLFIGGIELNPGPKNGYSVIQKSSSSKDKYIDSTQIERYIDEILNTSLPDLQKLNTEDDSLKTELIDKNEEIKRLKKDIEELTTRLNKQELCLKSVDSYLLLREQVCRTCYTENWGELKILLEGCLNKESLEYTQVMAIKTGDFTPPAAAKKRYLDLIQVLLIYGLPVNKGYKDNETLLHVASECGHVELAKFLISQGADVKVRKTNNETPLHRAAYQGYVNTVKVLLEHGAFINAKDNDGDTPLHNATYQKQYTVVKCLLNNDCNKSLTNKSGVTALDVATDNNSRQIMKLLS